ncbi:MAG: Uncharacterised protein [Pseudidiomarina mangrovi]|nr:MAG: Uncharacterised protein [Pseudidiomarina mangrovi]
MGDKQAITAELRVVIETVLANRFNTDSHALLVGLEHATMVKLGSVGIPPPQLQRGTGLIGAEISTFGLQIDKTSGALG